MAGYGGLGACSGGAHDLGSTSKVEGDQERAFVMLLSSGEGRCDCSARGEVRLELGLVLAVRRRRFDCVVVLSS